MSRPELIKLLKNKHPQLNSPLLEKIIDVFFKSIEKALIENKKRDQFVTAGLGYSSINEKNKSQFLINAFGTQNSNSDMNSSLISFTYNKKF